MVVLAFHQGTLLVTPKGPAKARLLGATKAGILLTALRGCNLHAK